jgi:hypothetical protein
LSEGLETITIKGDQPFLPCCGHDEDFENEKSNVRTRTVISGYSPMNLPPLPVTCFSCAIPFLPCMLLMNMSVWAWEFDLQADADSGGRSKLMLYERRKGICCEDRRLLIDCVTKVTAEEVTDEQQTTIQSRLRVKGFNNQLFEAPLTDFVEFEELEALANVINGIIPP